MRTVAKVIKVMKQSWNIDFKQNKNKKLWSLKHEIETWDLSNYPSIVYSFTILKVPKI